MNFPLANMHHQHATLHHLFEVVELLAIECPELVLAPVVPRLVGVRQRRPAPTDRLQALVGLDVLQLNQQLLGEQLVARAAHT